jgi:hypothetical protein
LGIQTHLRHTVTFCNSKMTGSTQYTNGSSDEYDEEEELTEKERSRWDKLEKWAACKIQAKFRGFVEREIYQKTVQAVVKLQSSIRGYFGRKEAKALPHPKRKRGRKRNKSVAERAKALDTTLSWAAEQPGTASFAQPTPNAKLAHTFTFDDTDDTHGGADSCWELMCTFSPLSSIYIGAIMVVVLSFSVALFEQVQTAPVSATKGAA